MELYSYSFLYLQGKMRFYEDCVAMSTERTPLNLCK